jgi:hypothetical protein
LRCNGSKGECFPQLFHKERDSVINIDRHVRTPVCAFLVFHIILHRATFPDLRASADHWTAGAPRPLCRSRAPDTRRYGHPLGWRAYLSGVCPASTARTCRTHRDKVRLMSGLEILLNNGRRSTYDVAGV